MQIGRTRLILWQSRETGTKVRDGILIKAAIVVNYKLTVENDKVTKAQQLAQIYERYGMGWNRTLFSRYESIIRHVYSKYNAEDIVQNRKQLDIDLNDKSLLDLTPLYFEHK